MQTAPIAERRRASQLACHLKSALFIPELKSKRKASVLEELVAHLAEHKVTKYPEAVLGVLKQREALGSTGVGKGIAIPHGRSTMVAERAVLLARSRKGIDFDSTDGEPVHLCFLIVAPPTERDPVYLQLLADIVKAVRISRVRQRLLEASDFETARAAIEAQFLDD